MKVYIASTPEVPSFLIYNVYNELNYSKGSIDYKILPSFSEKQFSRLVKSNKIDATKPLSFDKLFIICEGVRLIEDLSDKEIVVLLTSIKNNQDWFSASKGSNIFVDINDWEKYTGKDGRFGIAYQIVENIFQLLIHIDCDNARDSSFVHKKSIGCINDFCDDKKEVILKLRTADICEECTKRAKELKIKNITLLQIVDTIERIRDNIRSVIALKMIEPEVITVDKQCNIKIGHKIIDPPDLPKTLFIFFVNELKGVQLSELSKHVNRFKKIYHIIKPTGEEKSVVNMIKPYHSQDQTFSKYKSDLNKYLIKKLGDKLADYYTINKTSDLLFKLRVPSKFIKLSVKL
jgi:hypothetical protein